MKNLTLLKRGFAVRIHFQGVQYYAGEYQRQEVAQALAHELELAKKRALKRAKTEFEAELERLKAKAKAKADTIQSFNTKSSSEAAT